MERARFFMKFLLALAFIAVVAGNMVVYFTARPYLVESPADAPQAEAALILGAPLAQGGALSAIFADRADSAIALYEARKVSKILVSGDNSTLAHNEVDPVRRYLVDKRIPDQDIFLDYAGFDTYSTMYRARAIFGVSSLLIASQAFHLPRAVFIARALGIDAHGVHADVGPVLLRNYVREIFANGKALFDVATRRIPKYLGEQVPIEGERNYP